MEKKFNCKKCNMEIGDHNQYCHYGLCDDCFFDEYFPEEARIFETDIENIKRACQVNMKYNLKFKEFLKFGDFDQKRFNKIVEEVEAKIDCAKCRNCCKVASPSLNQAEIETIASYLNIQVNSFLKTYTQKDEMGETIFKQKPCVFLEDNKCKIQEVRPNDCKGFPDLKKDVTTRTLQLLSNAEICPIVFNVLENAKEEFLEEIYAFRNSELKSPFKKR